MPRSQPYDDGGRHLYVEEMASAKTLRQGQDWTMQEQKEGQCVWSLVNQSRKSVKQGHRDRQQPDQGSDFIPVKQEATEPVEAFNYQINRWKQADWLTWLLLRDIDLVLLTCLSCGTESLLNTWCVLILTALNCERIIDVQPTQIFIYSEPFEGNNCFLFFFIILLTRKISDIALKEIFKWMDEADSEIIVKGIVAR